MELRSLTLCWADRMSASRSITREVAEAALREQDWDAAWAYWGSLWEAGESTVEWLDTMEAAALPHARAGQFLAQQVVGGIGHNRYACGASLDVERFRGSLLWMVAALRQELSATGMQMLVEDYRILRSRGVRDSEIEAFLSEPGPKAAWERWTGKDPLS